jgi:YcxB-like protein
MITGTISASDYLDAQRLHRARAVRWFFVFCGVLITLGIVLMLFYSPQLGVMLVCAGVGLVAFELIFASLYLPWKVRRLHRQQKDLAAVFTYAWDDEFLEGKSANGQSKRRWRDYEKRKENEKMFLVYHADNLFEMFPKPWFRDQAQIDEFRSLTKPDTNR